MSSDKDEKSNVLTKEILDSLKPSDFDGHTSMAEMSAEQRLMWLSQAAIFVFENKKNLTSDC